MGREQIHWISEPMQIGAHLWRVGVGDYHLCGPGYDQLTRCTFYQFIHANGTINPNEQWKEAREWPSYDHNDTYNGLPKSLDRLYRREKRALDQLLLGMQLKLDVDNQKDLFNGG